MDLAPLTDCRRKLAACHSPQNGVGAVAQALSALALSKTAANRSPIIGLVTNIAVPPIEGNRPKKFAGGVGRQFVEFSRCARRRCGTIATAA
jgi:hypothetical protein